MQDIRHSRLIHIQYLLIRAENPFRDHPPDRVNIFTSPPVQNVPTTKEKSAANPHDVTVDDLPHRQRRRPIVNLHRLRSIL